MAYLGSHSTFSHFMMAALRQSSDQCYNFSCACNNLTRGGWVSYFQHAEVETKLRWTVVAHRNIKYIKLLYLRWSNGKLHSESYRDVEVDFCVEMRENIASSSIALPFLELSLTIQCESSTETSRLDDSEITATCSHQYSCIPGKWLGNPKTSWGRLDFSLAELTAESCSYYCMNIRSSREIKRG